MANKIKNFEDYYLSKLKDIKSKQKKDKVTVKFLLKNKYHTTQTDYKKLYRRI